MADYAPGQVVGVPCDTEDGAFPGECLVSFQTVDGPVTGFVKADQIETSRDGRKFLKATIQAVGPDTLSVWLRGSFFTTTGLATISRQSPLEAVAA